MFLEIGGWGGIAHYTYNLLNSLSRYVECTLLTEKDYELDNLARNFRVLNSQLSSITYPKAVANIYAALKKEEPCALHIQSTLSARRDWFFIFSKLKIPVFLTAHNVFSHSEKERKAWGMNFSLKMIYQKSAHIFLHSQYAKNKLKENFKIADDKITVYPHGNYLFARSLSALKNSQEAKEELGFSGQDKVILLFGAIREYKGIDLALESFSLALGKIPLLRFLIVGKPSGQEGIIKKKIIEKGLEGKIKLIASYVPLAEIGRYFSAADICIFPYYNIYASGALQLAYAFSKPVIAFRQGAFPEYVEDKKNGLLCDAGKEELAQAIIDIFNEYDLQRLGEASFLLAKDKFGWESIAQKTYNIYQRLT